MSRGAALRGVALPMVAWICVVIFLSAFGDAENQSAGADLFERRCSGCHALDRDKEGPRLRGVYGRQSGGVGTFGYSDALKNARITWDSASLDKWLTDPEKLIPDSDMAFRVAKTEERGVIIAYLKQISGK